MMECLPNLAFHVERVEVAEHAAVPTLLFNVLIDEQHGIALEAVTLQTQIRIVPMRRTYSDEERMGLTELFGGSTQWSGSLKSLLWTQSVVHVPSFTGRTVVILPVTCTYDFEVVGAKYVHSLTGGDIPLELFFSGTMFFRDHGEALQIAPIPWDKETQHRLPVSLWKDMIERYFPHCAWLRLPRDTFERLYHYRSQKGLPTWDAALDELLRASCKEAAR